ncbi:PKD domain-containing protein [Changchengzhania lutea]|uniref:PKD domain-containing protein n=1 Tax=Changchengzhania lutea TaxID=2049305 RepID=UPI00115E47E6|nr:PKD domain-containing protein [Changchengzhania lutea]
MKKLIKTFKYISVLILALSFVGCEDDDVVLPKVTAGFTYTLNSDTGVVTFINTSENANTYAWDLGDTSGSTLINPVKAYENGTYTIVLEANNVSGATDTFEDEITILIPEIATLPITFDGENTKYEAEVFNGASFEVVDNPAPGGANASTSKVGAITNSGAAFEGFYIDLGTQIDLTTDKTIKVIFWSNTAVDVLLKLEEGTAAASEATASHGGTGWEEIYFTFDSAASYSRFTMFVDGPGTTSGTFYIDDISQIATADIPCLETELELPIDFDCNGIAYTDKIVGNVSFDVVDNPELSGINSEASKVGKITNVGANWENAFFNLDTALDLSTDKGIKFKFFSDQALPLKLKLEDGTEAAIEVDVNHTGTGWEELTFAFTSSASYNDVVLFVDGPGTAAGIFYIDDIEQVSVTPTSPACTDTALVLPIDFDCDGIDYESKRVAGDIGFSIIDNPQVNGINAVATKVGEIVNIGNNWENLNFTLDTPIDFSTDKSIKLKLYSTQSLPIKLKVEGGGTPVENDQNHGGTGWEELTFTLATSESFSNLIVFIDGPGNAVGTFYIDDIEQVASGGGGTACTDTTLELAIDFDCESIDYESKRVAGDIGFSIIDNPQVNGINAVATKVGEIVNIGNNWENLNFTLDTPIDFSTDKSIKLKLYSTQSLPIKLKVEGGGTPVENDQNHVGTGWEELIFTLATSESFSNIIVFIDGPGNAVGTFYIDDIEQVASGGGGTGCTIDPPTGELLANGGFEANSGDGACWQFNLGGGTAAVSTEQVNTGTYSAKLTTGANQAPNIKMERFASSITGGVTVQVSFKYRFTTALGTGSILQVLAFSELSAGAVEHNLGNAPDTPLDTWNTFTQTFVTDGNIDGNISLLLQLTGSGNADGGGVVYIDDVQVTQL